MTFQEFKNMVLYHTIVEWNDNEIVLDNYFRHSNAYFLGPDNKAIKHITATSACEAELKTRKLRNFECNTETDILTASIDLTTVAVNVIDDGLL